MWAGRANKGGLRTRALKKSEKKKPRWPRNDSPKKGNTGSEERNTKQGKRKVMSQNQNGEQPTAHSKGGPGRGGQRSGTEKKITHGSRERQKKERGTPRGKTEKQERTSLGKKKIVKHRPKDPSRACVPKKKKGRCNYIYISLFTQKGAAPEKTRA